MRKRYLENSKKENNPDFYNKDGQLNDYALSCGYIQVTEFCEDRHMHLLKDGCYHVRIYNHKEHSRELWCSFDSLTEARKVFKTIERNHSK